MKDDYTPMQRLAIKTAIHYLDGAVRWMEQGDVPDDLKLEVSAVAHKLKPFLPEVRDWRTP